jgi:hypothetical protein
VFYLFLALVIDYSNQSTQLMSTSTIPDDYSQ